MKLIWRKILLDPTFWLLLAVNVALVYSYEMHPEIFTTLIWLYWSQSVLFGIFNYIDIRTSKTFVPDFSSGDGQADTAKLTADAYGWVFTAMYAFFHLVYIVFIATMKKIGPFEWDFFRKYLLTFFIFQVLSFIQHKVQNKDKAQDVTKMATRPFVRVIPMHLCILIPAFINVSNLTVFIILKVITDMLSYVFTTDYYKKATSVVTMTAMNIDP